MTLPTNKLTLADLSLPARLVLAVFLIAVGLGYFSALIQLRVQHASEGRAMPSSEDVRRTFSGTEGKSQLERLLTAPISEPFNGSGSMAGAFIDPANTNGWPKAVRELQKNNKLPPDQAEERVRQKRDGERLMLVDWIRNGADENAYTNNAYVVPEALVTELKLKSDDPNITETFLDTSAGGKPIVKIQSIIQNRCVRCHRSGASGAAAQFPLDSYEELVTYLTPEKVGGMSLAKLAQSTHVHLLGFAVLWCLTGLLFACTSYPAFIRAVFGPWTLIAQIADIVCWWLAATDPRFADAIIVTGALVGLGLAVQLVGTSLDLFRKGGKLLMILVLLLVGVGVAGFYMKAVEPRLKISHSLTTPATE
jgi:hypothetical protein